MGETATPLKAGEQRKTLDVRAFVGDVEVEIPPVQDVSVAAMLQLCREALATARRYHSLEAPAPRKRGARVHSAPRRTSPRARGAGRPGARSTTDASRSGDGGDEGPSDEPPPRRLCSFCGKDIPADRSPRAKYCKGAHADRDRQRRKRQRDRERDVRPRIPTTADERRMYEITEELAEQLRARAFCGCNGRHLEFDPGACFRCGHWLPLEVVA
jgi:hypothetical protein